MINNAKKMELSQKTRDLFYQERRKTYLRCLNSLDQTKMKNSKMRDTKDKEWEQLMAMHIMKILAYKTISVLIKKRRVPVKASTI